jgi:hypothetical protein
VLNGQQREHKTSLARRQVTSAQDNVSPLDRQLTTEIDSQLWQEFSKMTTSGAAYYPTGVDDD